MLFNKVTPAQDLVNMVRAGDGVGNRYLPLRMIFVNHGAHTPLVWWVWSLSPGHLLTDSPVNTFSPDFSSIRRGTQWIRLKSIIAVTFGNVLPHLQDNQIFSCVVEGYWIKLISIIIIEPEYCIIQPILCEGLSAYCPEIISILVTNCLFDTTHY